MTTALALGTALRGASEAMEAFLSRRLKPASITPQHTRALSLVLSGEGDTAAMLCAAMGMTAGPMTRMLDRVEERGWLERRRVVSDRRVWRLELTAAGESVLATALPIVDQAWREATAALSLPRMTTTEEMLSAIVRAATDLS